VICYYTLRFAAKSYLNVVRSCVNVVKSYLNVVKSYVNVVKSYVNMVKSYGNDQDKASLTYLCESIFYPTD
jgi:hypothetical protein